MTTDLLAAAMIGFLGSSHCILMCGGIVAAIQFSLPDASFRKKFLLQSLLNTGRLTTYACLGGCVGYFGVSAMQLAGLSMLWLRLFSGVLLLMMALYISRIWFGLAFLERAGRPIWQKIQPLTKQLLPINTLNKAYLYGLLWGWLPCGLVYTTLSWSLASGGILPGAMLMLAFGFGTLPSMLVFGSLAERLSRLKNLPFIRYCAASLLAIYGGYTIWLALSRLVF